MDQQRTIGKYQILERIASGAQGSVDRAYDPDDGKLVAIKVLHSSFLDDQSFIERFQREAGLAASVDHPNVVRIFDVGEDNGQQFIAMEFLPENLHRLIEQRRLPAERAAMLAAQIADGLGAIHDLGIVHRDMKPRNVLITPEGVAKITDFGIARGEELATITATGVMMGTPHYMSPEQAEGERADARSDVYALGCMMYQMLTGDVPHSADTPLAVLKKHVEQTPRPIAEIIDGIRPELIDVVERALAKDPAERFDNGAAMATALREAMPEIVPDTDEAEVAEEPQIVSEPESEIRPETAPDEAVASDFDLDLDPDIAHLEERTTPAVDETPALPSSVPSKSTEPEPRVFKVTIDADDSDVEKKSSNVTRTVWSVVAVGVLALIAWSLVTSDIFGGGERIEIVHWSTGHLTRDGLLPEMAQKFNEQNHRTPAGQRIQVKVYDAPSELQAAYLIPRVKFGTRLDLNEITNGYVVKNIPDPTILTPSSAHWLVSANYELEREAVDIDNALSIVRPVIGIVTYEDMARCLGWPEKALGFADIIALRDDPQGWASYPCAQASWGQKPLLAFTDPTTSSTGRSLHLSLYSIGANKAPQDLTIEDVNDPKVVAYVERFQRLLDDSLMGTTVVKTEI